MQGGYAGRRRFTMSTGAVAPEIMLPAGCGQTWALHDSRGRPVVVLFYPADWEPVSTDQLRCSNDALPQMRKLGAELVGISVDGVWCHQAFARELRLQFRLLSDSQPRGAAARAYGVYRPRDGRSERALFVIDAVGIVRWHDLVPAEVNPGVGGILTALEALAPSRDSTADSWGRFDQTGARVDMAAAAPRAGERISIKAQA